MSKIPEALRYAQRFEDVGDWYEFDSQYWFPLAAAELRRQHALNAELLVALRMSVAAFDGDAIDDIEDKYGLGTAQRIAAARAAIARAEASQ